MGNLWFLVRNLINDLQSEVDKINIYLLCIYYEFSSDNNIQCVNQLQKLNCFKKKKKKKEKKKRIPSNLI